MLILNIHNTAGQYSVNPFVKSAVLHPVMGTVYNVHCIDNIANNKMG